MDVITVSVGMKYHNNPVFCGEVLNQQQNSSQSRLEEDWVTDSPVRTGTALVPTVRIESLHTGFITDRERVGISLQSSIYP